MKDILTVLKEQRQALRVRQAKMDRQLVRFDQAILILNGQPGRRYKLSAATRRKMAASQQRRWAKVRAAA